MSDTNNTLKKKENQYHHLTKKDRTTIQTLIEQKDKNGKRLFNNTYISNDLGVHRSTISRKLKNRKSYRFIVRSDRSIENPYNATDAHNNYLFKRCLSKGQYKLRKYSKMAKYIEDKIKIDKWIPDAIISYMKFHNYFLKDGFTSITVPTIYSTIRYGIINVKLENTRRMKYKPEYEYKDKISLPISKIPYSIENRPEEINNRSTFGHFEIDTGRGKHECLLTITERKTKFEIIFKISSKTTENVVNKINQIKLFMNKHYNKIFKYFSTDNGTKFSDFLGIIKDSKTQIYFCHPDCSSEKGTNEKQNIMIRYFIPKKI